MEDLVRVLELYGLQIVFAGVLLDQGGLPLPSFSLVMVAAGVATETGAPGVADLRRRRARHDRGRL